MSEILVPTPKAWPSIAPALTEDTILIKDKIIKYYELQKSNDVKNFWTFYEVISD